MSGWKGMQDILINLDVKQSNYRVFRVGKGGVKHSKDAVSLTGLPSDVDEERGFGKWILSKFGVGRGVSDLDKEFDLVFNKDFFYSTRDGSKPQVFVAFPDELSGLPSGIRNHYTARTLFELWYTATADAIAKVEALKNRQMQEAEFWNVITSSQNKFGEAFEDMFKNLVMKTMDEKGVRSPVQGGVQQSPGGGSGGFVPNL